MPLELNYLVQMEDKIKRRLVMKLVILIVNDMAIIPVTMASVRAMEECNNDDGTC